MKDRSMKIADMQKLSTKVSQVFQKRMQLAQKRFNMKVQDAYKEQIADLIGKPASPWEIWTNWLQYSTDFVQRSVLFWDTMRQRGNNFVQHERAGKPPVLHFDYEIVVDARTFERPVNYALVRIIPPGGVTVDPRRRPYIIIDPRAGHGPGIGDSRMILRSASPCAKGTQSTLSSFSLIQSRGRRCLTYAMPRSALCTR